MERHCPRCDRSFPDGSRCPDDGTELVVLDADDSMVGREIGGRFTLKRRLGAGAMGAVYVAWQHSMGRDVAVKIVHPRFGNDAEAAKRFLREVKLASRLSQPNTVSLHDFGQTEDGVLFFAMELLRGRTLAEVRGKSGVFAPERVVRIGVQLCDALEAAHRLEIVHRDLKPANIVVLDDPPGRDLIKVLDFGLAKSLADEHDASVTQSGAVLGTPSYMSPEAVRGEPCDARSDLYSLGVILAELASGALPFRARSVNEMLRQHLDAPPQLAPSLPPALRDVLLRLMAKLPAARYPDAAAAREALLASAQTAATSPPRAAAPVSGLDATAASHDDLATSDTAAGLASPAATPLAAAPVTAAPVATAPTTTAGVGRAAWVTGLIVLISAGGVLLLGYPGFSAHDPRQWMKFAGAPAWGILLACALSTVAALLGAAGRVSRLWSWWLALSCPAFGGLVTEMSMHMVRLHTARDAPAQRFTMFAIGTWQANHALFLGFVCGFVALMAVSASYGVGESGRSPSSDVRATFGLGALGAGALVLGVPDGAFAAFAAALSLSLSLMLPRAREQLAGRVASLLAAAMALLLVGFARPVANEAAMWFQEDPRATRAALVVSSVTSRWKLNAFLVAVVAVLVFVELARGVSWRQLRPARAGTLLAAAATLLVVLATAQHFNIVAQRAELYRSMAPQFALFARLDPPVGEGLDGERFTPHAAPALQLGREDLSIDGVGVAKLASLEAPDGQLILMRELGRTLAAPRERTPEDPDLSVAADRQLRYHSVVRALAVAQRAGVHRVELLLTRGGPPLLGGEAPPEASYVLPSDFVAIPLVLSKDAANPAELSRTFGELAPSLIDRARAAKGPLSLPLGEAAPHDDLAAAEARLRDSPYDPDSLALAGGVACAHHDKESAAQWLGTLPPDRIDKALAACEAAGLYIDRMGAADASLHYRVDVLFRTELVKCYHAAKERRPKLRGVSKLSFTIHRDGALVDLGVKGEDEELNSCVRDKFPVVRTWRFGRPIEGVIKMSVPIIFSD
jgi:serine/threonine-protein kinase